MKTKYKFNRLKLVFSYREIIASKRALEERENILVSEALDYMHDVIGDDKVMRIDLTLWVRGDVIMAFKVTELMFISTHLVAKIDDKWTCQPFENNGCTFKHFNKLVESLSSDDFELRDKTDEEMNLTWWDITYMPFNKAY